MRRFSLFPWLAFTALAAFYVSLATAVSGQEPLNIQEKTAYKLGQAIPVSCLNRTIDTGEHITNAQGELQYIPFPTCSETGRPLELYFGVEKDVNCTIDFITDPLFHLLEFYVHNDAPLTCRIPSRPLPSSSSTFSPSAAVDASAPAGTAYIPLIIALGGILQSSHIHVANNLNVLLHAAPLALAPGTIEAATAYSVHTLTQHTRIVIGDSLPLRLSVRWYPTTALPSGWTGYGGHLYLSTLFYCGCSAGAATLICIAYFRGVELPRRLRSYGKERAFGSEGGRYGGYGYGVANGNGNGYGIGKRD
ncbi:hypothetical protein W97_07466 [Coniosporium apollinis CBS 100218]|uniref:Uncharacterized protein n=1 Tax=Coniosporium apollinis (strain CBS 100218) TaxID=1168221 RepID=R7Z290_CONA1|nr:uncharacterized protein W97_07466 [Coniosporium apollinis CBS 100218]EON68208.1 hypothetical protein W97_07466 [Coniosporium apollinis CBS 100218]